MQRGNAELLSSPVRGKGMSYTHRILMAALVSVALVSTSGMAEASFLKKLGKSISKTVKVVERKTVNTVKDAGRIVKKDAKVVGRGIGGAGKAIGKTAVGVGQFGVRTGGKVVKTADKAASAVGKAASDAHEYVFSTKWNRQQAQRREREQTQKNIAQQNASRQTAYNKAVTDSRSMAGNKACPPVKVGGSTIVNYNCR